MNFYTEKGCKCDMGNMRKSGKGCLNLEPIYTYETKLKTRNKIDEKFGAKVLAKNNILEA